MYKFENGLRERLGRLAQFFGEDWHLDDAFETVNGLFAVDEPCEGSTREWEYFQLLMDELQTDAVTPPFDAVWRSYCWTHPEPLDWDSVVCDFADVHNVFPAEVARLVQEATLIGTNDDYPITRKLERIGFAIERGVNREVKLATSGSLQTFATPTQLLDGLLASF